MDFVYDSYSYEYASEGVEKEIDNLQNIPMDVVSFWMDKFKESGIFFISDIDRDIVGNDTTYDILAAQNIHSLIAVPLIKEENITGFMGVDNPSENQDDLYLLSAAQFFIMDAFEKKMRKKFWNGRAFMIHLQEFIIEISLIR